MEMGMKDNNELYEKKPNIKLKISSDIKNKIERRIKREQIKLIMDKNLPEDFFKNVVELENLIQKDEAIDNFFDLFSLYKVFSSNNQVGVEYYSDKNTNLYYGFMTKFQRMLSNKKLMKHLLYYSKNNTKDNLFIRERSKTQIDFLRKLTFDEIKKKV